MLCDDGMLLFRGYKSLTHMSEIRSNPVQSAGKGAVVFHIVIRSRQA
jgi:hypothetical protein